MQLGRLADTCRGRSCPGRSSLCTSSALRFCPLPPPPSTLAQIATTWRPTPCTQGKSWQFKDFHVKEPAQVTSAVQRGSCCSCLISHQIFSTVKGFYVQYTESLCDACVAAWNVQVLHKTVKIYHGAPDVACRWCASAAAAAIWTAPPSARCGRASRSMRTGAG
jgi:hypothetical protein